MTPEFANLMRRENPWLEQPDAWRQLVQQRLPEHYIPRRQPDVAKLEADGFSASKATLVIGPRQAGKSSWVWNAIAQGDPGALFIDCERPIVQQWCTDPGRVLEDVELLVRDPTLLFFEEAQHLEEAGLFVKGLIDRRASMPIVVTGSSSYHLRARTRESLAGRAQKPRLFPFSLGEVTADVAQLAPALADAVRRERFARHVIVGGYPSVWQSPRPAEGLADLVDAFVIRDASDLFEIRRPDAFRLLMRLAARQISSAVNLTEWATITGVSVPTVATYLSHMEESHIVVQLPLFAGGKRAELTQAPKLYFVDCGVRNSLVGDLGPFDLRGDRGALLENWVFSELYKTLPHSVWIGWWRTRGGAEVDLVIRDGERIIGVEVKAGTQMRPKLTRSARSFIDAYTPHTFFVASTGIEHTDAVESTSVRWCHPTDIATQVARTLTAA